MIFKKEGYQLQLAFMAKLNVILFIQKGNQKNGEIMETPPKFKGIAVNHRWKFYNSYECAHDLCSAHIMVN